jgi:hypothetical protein
MPKTKYLSIILIKLISIIFMVRGFTRKRAAFRVRMELDSNQWLAIKFLE